MTNPYLVNCPHFGCGWSGYLPGSLEPDFLRGTTTNVSIVSFQCRACRRDWQARVIDNDLETLPLDDILEPAGWPPIDLGGSD
jgi:hypothetical protein